ncbi:MAG: hypothetical protein R3E58_14700 [Phycisphaerae bacterium]|nr:hypothetical protein [Phycisphaerales bacterium]
MASFFGMLLGGYLLIVFSYMFVWVIVAGMARDVSAERMDKITKADVKAVAVVMAAWTVALGLMMVVDWMG